MDKKSIIIIGGGIAGLSAGCYAQMNGYDSQIFELHTLPGGLCTSWSRKGYTFDGCIHWLVGSGEGKLMNNLWRELGALKDTEVVNHEEFTRFRDTDGRELILYTDIDQLEKHLIGLSPTDAKAIHEMAEVVRKLGKFNPPMEKPRELLSAFDGLAAIPRMMPLMGIFKKYGQMTVNEYVTQFTDPLLRKGLGSFAGGLADFPVLGLLMTLGYLNDRNAGFPMGGSLKFAQAIEKRYEALGGVIHYQARVEKILVEQDTAVGIRLCDGQEYRADTVVSAADGYATIFKMLEEKYINEEIRGYYKEMPIFRPIVQVAMGVKGDFSDKPHMLSLQLRDPIIVAGEPRNSFGIKHYCYDSTLAPQGKSVVEVMYPCDYGYWKALADEPEKYEAEKKQIALTVMSQIDKVYPGFSEQVEVVDVATPLTYERYTGNWQGSMEGWLLTTRTMAMSTTGKAMSKTLPGLKNFYMIGQWVEPGGGVPTAAMSARNAMQLICHQDKRSFVTSLS